MVFPNVIFADSLSGAIKYFGETYSLSGGKGIVTVTKNSFVEASNPYNAANIIPFPVTSNTPTPSNTADPTQTPTLTPPVTPTPTLTRTPTLTPTPTQ